ncbi:macrophage mannose receptor 1-like isoform X2 [Panulirus ornatus]|uniref:macrophage mannose receptor 1-like isoform X2 n=1 Tax=Panulirus ornatus TaxID=150431 RepID=UPI003A865A4A
MLPQLLMLLFLLLDGNCVGSAELWVPEAHVGCEDGWASFGSYCYYFSNDDNIYPLSTYNGAREACRSKGADLVSIHSVEENDFVTSMFTGHDATATWIGVTDIGQRGVVSWSDGSPLTFTRWSSLTNHSFMHYPTCGRFTTIYELNGHSSWNLGDCEGYKYYICKKSKQSQHVHPANTDCIKCSSRRKRFADFERKPWITQDHSDFSKPSFSLKFSSPFHSRFSYHNNEVHKFMHHPLLRIPEQRTFTMSPPTVSLDFLHHRFRNTFKSSRGIPYVSEVNLGKDLKNTQQYLSISNAADTVESDSSNANNIPLNMSQPPLTTTDEYLPTSTTPDSTANRTDGSRRKETITPIGSLTKSCELGDEAYKGSCYSIIPGVPQSWNRAEAACESRGAHLVVLNDRFESGFVSTYLGELKGRAWIGLSGTTEVDGSIGFSWVNSDTLDFTNWDEFEPASDHGACVATSGEKTNPGLWIVTSCEDELQFICEYDRDDYIPPTLSSPMSPPAHCAYGWDHRGTRCYRVSPHVFPEPLSWHEGEHWCSSHGGHLASIGSAEEQTAIYELPGLLDFSDVYDSVWVGLKLDLDSEYYWTDGTVLDYIDWATDQPDNHHGREKCGSADLSTLKLSDTVCHAYLPFICEAAEDLMVTTMVTPSKVPDTQCDDDPSWLLYGHYCYKFISASDEDPQTWWDSHKLCRNEGAELASIHTYEENYWIESKISKLSDSILWIGGRSKLDSGYTWLDDSAFDFVNWAKGEPNNFFDQEDCIGLYNHQQGYWNDQNCAHKEGRICKRQHGMTLPPMQTTQAPEGRCHKGWLHIGTKCIKFLTDKKNFTSARKSCRDLDDHADLMCIHSALEQAYLTVVLGTMNINVWVGLRNERGYHWVDQTPVTYTNWAPGEPNGDQQIITQLQFWKYHKDEECVELMTSNRAGQWNDVECSSLLGYICETPKDPQLPTDFPHPSCDPPFDNYVRYNGACYRPIATAKTWQEAESSCESEGAHLASILDLSEGAMMWVLTEENGFSHTWLGLNNLQDKHIFKWSDGWPALYTNWAFGEPNVTLDDYNCIRLGSTNGLWSVERCEEASPFICKFREGMVPTPDPAVNGHCPDSRWLDLGGGYCYLVFEQTKPWKDASMNCVQENANLVSIHTEAEMNLINLATHNMKDPVWIGLVRKTNGFGWSDGTGLDFVNWDKGEPNDEEEECAELYTFSGRWNDASCSFARAYICKTLKIAHIPSTNLPPLGTTHSSQGWSQKPMSAGGTIGIIMTVLLVVAGIGLFGYSYIQKKPKRVGDGESYGFDNALYSGGDDSIRVQVRGVQAATFTFVNHNDADASSTP